MRPMAERTLIFRLFFVWSLCILGVQAAEGEPNFAQEADENEFRVASPQPGALIVSGAMPVLVRLPMSMRFHKPALSVDGVKLNHAPAVVRRRWWKGKGVDLIATVPTAALEPGWHTLTVDLEPTKVRRLMAVQNLSLESGQIEGRFRFQPRPMRLNLRVFDEQGQPRSGRIQVFDPTGEPVALGNATDANGDPSGRDVPRTGVFVGPEGAVEFVNPGEYTLLASGGIRDGVDQQTVVIDQSQLLKFTVPQLIQTEGEVTADLHVHTALSSDSFIPDSDRFRALSAASVDVAVITDHNRIRDPRPAIEMLGLLDELETITGAELRLGAQGTSLGHANAFPLRAGERAPLAGEAPPAQAFAAWRAHHKAHPIEGSSAPLVIQLNHPRGIQFDPAKKHRRDAHALFEDLKFDPKKPIEKQPDKRLRVRDKAQGKSFLDVDAIEILNRFSVEGWRAVRADWFTLLNRGHRLTGTGNSDSHTSQLEPVGFPVNLVSVDGTGTDAFVRGVASGRVRVSSGPLVSLVVEGPTSEVKPSKKTQALGATVKARIRVEAVDWVPVAEVRLVHNGRVVFQAEATEVATAGHQEWVVPVYLATDGWLLAEAGWPLSSKPRPSEGVYAKLAPGHVPIGFTNPVFLDANGDGIWTPIEGPEDPKLR